MRQAPSIADAEAKRAALRRNKRLATGLLIAAVALAVGTALLPDRPFAVQLINAAAEAAIVGGLADWFAVTALFRRPLGLPIPHTALIPARKDEIGKSLAAFVRDQFLDPPVLIERLRAENRALQLSQLLASDAAASFVAERVAAVVPIVLRSVDDASIRAFLRDVAQDGLRRLDLVATMDSVIEALIRDGKHMELADALIDVLEPSLEALGDVIAEKVGERTGRFFPSYFDRKIGDGIVNGVEKWLLAVRTAGSAERLRLDAWMRARLAELRASPDYAGLMERAQAAIVTHPALLHALATIWDEIKRELTEDARSSNPRAGKVAGEIARTIGRLVQETPELQRLLNAAIEGVVVGYITPWRAQIADYIASVVAGWDGRKVAEVIELQVGRDLQYVRINGTLVGALIGSALFLMRAGLPSLLTAMSAIKF
ncbi:MAG TPA: DUF445 domain-containing protein [Stellaceae bacterium]|nr:DUF445 domain-containing protein [Stellaceae bacterium]